VHHNPLVNYPQTYGIASVAERFRLLEFAEGFVGAKGSSVHNAFARAYRKKWSRE
jgi:hypothetical protein